MRGRGQTKSEFAAGSHTWELEPRLCSRPSREMPWRPVKMATCELPLRHGSEPEPEPECMLLHTAGPAVRLRSVDTRGSRVDVTTRVEAFREQPTCLDLRAGTGHDAEKGAAALAVVGLHSGEVVLLDPLQQRMLAIWNKDHANASGRCTDIAWAPHDPLQFAASFASGAVLHFELGRVKEEKLGSGGSGGGSSGGAPGGGGGGTKELAAVVISEPKSNKYNPRQRWLVSKDPVLAIQYGPSSSSDAASSSTAGLLAVGSGEGALRIFDTATGLPVISFCSYYGAVRCVDWSADGRYLITGGEEDNILVWSLEEQRQVARCAGHSSWISAVHFMPWPAGPGEAGGIYTFASAGWDGRLCIWELDPAATAGKAPAASGDAGGGGSAQVVSAVGERDRSVVRIVALVDETSLHTKPLSSLASSAGQLFTGCDANEVKAWSRPLPAAPAPPISGEVDEDGLADVESDPDSDEEDESQPATEAEFDA